MAKLVLNDIASLANTNSAKQALNDNFTAIEAAIENTLSRDGTLPNHMEADIDLNGNDLLNAGFVDASQYLLNGVPLEQTVAYANKGYKLFSGTGAQTDFLLDFDPGSLGNLDISISGASQRPGLDFNFVGTTLVFAVAPPAGTDNILVRYDQALPTGITSADAILYTSPSSGDIMSMRQFLDLLWEPGDETGGALLRFIQIGLGAIAQDMQDKVRERVSVKDFGAVGDGIVDDTLAIQKAMDSFASVGFGNLYFPKGTYKISTPLIVSFNGSITGDGIGASVLQLNTDTQNGIVVAYSGYLAIRDMEFTAGVAKTAGAAIRVEGLGGQAAGQTLIANCRMQNQYIGIDMANAGYWTIENCRIFEPVQFGIYVDNTQNYDAGDNLIKACTLQKTAVTSGTAGVMHVASGGTKLIGNKILGFDRGYALIPRDGTPKPIIIDTQLVGNSIEDGNTAIFIQTPIAGTSVGQMTLNSNQMSNKTNGIVLIGAAAGITMGDNQITCNFPGHIGIYIDSMNGSPSQVSVADNVITGNSSAGSIGIYTGNLANIHLTDNKISGAASPYTNVANTIIRGFDLPFSLLPVAGNGSYGFVPDGTTASPVAGGGTGCFAKRLNGVWVGN